jgi:hypothetical protein
MQAALRSRLLADATIAGLVGTRVDWGLRPQAKSLPAISMTLIPTPRDYHMGGAQTTQFYMVQIDAWAEKYKDAHALRQAIITELEQSSGEFLFSFLERDQDMPEVIDTGPINRASMDFKITHIPA